MTARIKIMSVTGKWVNFRYEVSNARSRISKTHLTQLRESGKVAIINPNKLIE